jgi:hypothetical protein
MLRIPHCLDNRLTDGGQIVSPQHKIENFSKMVATILITFKQFMEAITLNKAEWLVFSRE